MQYRGEVKDGVVVFQEVPPPDGTLVRIEVISAPAENATVWDKLKKYSGIVKGLPTDMARNHDHYIHGGPRK